MLATESLLEAFSQLDDPRKARGVRHPFSGIVVLMLLGMLARIRANKSGQIIGQIKGDAAHCSPFELRPLSLVLPPRRMKKGTSSRATSSMAGSRERRVHPQNA